MRTIPFCLAVLLLSCVYDRPSARAAGPPARTRARDLVPAGAQWVFSGDATRVRRTAVARTFGRLSARERVVFPALREAGVDVLRDVDGVVVAGRFDEDWFVILAEHDMDPAKAHRFVDILLGIGDAPITSEVIGGHLVKRVDDPPVAAVIVHEGLLAFLALDRLPQFLGQLDSERDDRDGLSRRLRDALERSPLPEPFLVGVADSPPPPPRIPDADVPEVPPPRRIAVWATLEDGLRVDFHAEYSRADQASDVGARLERIMDPDGSLHSYLELMQMGTVARRATVRVRGERVLVRLAVSPDELGRLLARVELLAEE